VRAADFACSLEGLESLAANGTDAAAIVVAAASTTASVRVLAVVMQPRKTGRELRPGTDIGRDASPLHAPHGRLCRATRAKRARCVLTSSRVDVELRRFYGAGWWSFT
jgi:hypothetical protein